MNGLTWHEAEELCICPQIVAGEGHVGDGEWLAETCEAHTDLVERILAARGEALAGKVRALADEWEAEAKRLYGEARKHGDLEADWHASGHVWHANRLRALLDADLVPDVRPPLPERVDAVIRRSRNLREGLVEAIQSGELAP